MPLPVCLSIAGSDSGAAAGVQADTLTFSAFGVYAVNAITCVTAQNPKKIFDVEPLSADIVLSQINALKEYYSIGAVKTGMLLSKETILAVSQSFNYSDVPLVLDPVMVSTSGRCLLEKDALGVLTEKLFPCAKLVTPNLDEVEVLLGFRPSSEDEMIDAVNSLVEEYGVAFLVKGGHLDTSELVDVLKEPGCERVIFRADSISDVDTHGSGCTLASAIASGLSKEESLLDSVRMAHGYLQKALKKPLYINDQAFINHGVRP